MEKWGQWLWGWANDLSTAVFIITVALGLWLFLSGVAPVLWRMGNLRRRKIAVFAKGATSQSLVSLIEDARLFNSKNIIPIVSASDFGRADQATVFVIFWPDWTGDLDQILGMKADQTPVVVYAPHTHPRVPDPTLQLLDQHRNVVLTNFRGRLLNDIVISFITTAYEKR